MKILVIEPSKLIQQMLEQMIQNIGFEVVAPLH